MMAAPTALPDPETIRRTAAEILQRREYLLDHESKSDQVWASFFLRIVEAFANLFRWMFKLVEGLPEWLQYVVVFGMVAILVAILCHMIYSIATLFWGVKKDDQLVTKLSNTVLDPEMLERQATEAAAKGDCSLAVRLLFRACLLRLEQAESRKFRGGTTNREVLRRHRNSPVYEPMKLFVEILEIKWYGLGVCSQSDYESCRQAHAELVRSAKGAGDVHDA